MISLPDLDEKRSEVQSSTLAGPVRFLPSSRYEDELAAAFEKGFSEGADAVRKELRERELALSEALVEKLQEISFTHAEARQGVLRSLKPLFLAIADSVVPGLANDAAGAFLAKRAAEIAAEQINPQVVLYVSTDDQALINRIEYAVSDQPCGPEIRQDPDLGEGEIRLQNGDEEFLFSAKEAVAEMQKKLRAFFETTTEGSQHG